MQYSYEWSLYEGDYEKEFYDIKDVHGTQYDECWPNAGKFRSASGHVIPEKYVIEIRLTQVDYDGSGK